MAKLRKWAGYLMVPLSKDDREKIHEKAESQGKHMVKVTVSKQGAKKHVTGP